jgi:hypothetical protein
MANFYKNTEVLNIAGYEIYFTRFADSIIKDHFNDAEADLQEILQSFKINEPQIIQGGGGLSSITQELGKNLTNHSWIKECIESEHHVRGKILTSESHEVDHYKSFQQGNLALEIEWNNKDPFFDRDLENFRKLHQIGELSVGIIITRGTSLQKELLQVFHRFLFELWPVNVEKLLKFISLSIKDQVIISRLLKQQKEKALADVARKIYSSKYGVTTTHMGKLLLRINRGVGNPCPLILIGIGKERLITDE